MATAAAVIAVSYTVNGTLSGTFRTIPVSYAGVAIGQSGPFMTGSAKFEVTVNAGDTIAVVWGALTPLAGVNFASGIFSTSVELRPK